MNASQNPYAPPGLEPASSKTHRQKYHVGWDRVILVLAIIVCAVGAPLSFYELESIVGSGIAMFVVCLLLLTRECYCRFNLSRPPWWFLFYLSFLGLAFVFGLFAMIGVLKWSPRQAEANHVAEMVTCFACIMAGACLVAIYQPPAVIIESETPAHATEPVA